MMLNRDRDREREGFCWLFETKALIGMVLIPMFLLVSFGFESLPLPVPYSSFESRSFSSSYEQWFSGTGF